MKTELKNTAKRPTPRMKASSFREVLKQEFSRRLKENPRYSLRAFAKCLGTDVSRLSKILRNQRPVREDLIQQFGQKLRLRPEEIEGYKGSAQLSLSKVTANAAEIDHTYLQITQDNFEVISDPIHYAILETMKLSDFVASSAWVAKRLKIQRTQVELCIERLQRVGLLNIGENGEWIDVSSGSSTHILGENYTSYAHKESQEIILNQAIHALREIPIENRDQSSTMMTSSPERIRIAKKLITQFRRSLAHFLEDTSDKTAIYQLSVSLFPVTEIENSNAKRSQENEK